ncbi:hypothetical protein [Rhizobium mongolense]|uniref:hypothetical protein n=1 Tax=Rhizobium mongolense TaxID=57676 RepID=UPI00111447BA|nr:hypothetical protein [Rhizobium mongolense]
MDNLPTKLTATYVSRDHEAAEDIDFVERLFRLQRAVQSDLTRFARLRSGRVFTDVLPEAPASSGNRHRKPWQD